MNVSTNALPRCACYVRDRCGKRRLALWGADDPFTPFERGLHPGAKFPEYNAGLVVKNLGNYGHCPHDAAPELVNPIVCEFLKDPPALSAVSTSGLKSDDAER